MDRISIDKNAPLNAGDIVELEFKWLTDYTWLRAAQWYAIESHLKASYDNFKVLTWNNGDTALTVRVEVIAPKVPDPQRQEAGINITAIIIATAVVGSFLLWYLSLDGTYKIVDTPAVKIGASALLIFAIAYFLLVWRKK